jgi:hypothetical protein
MFSNVASRKEKKLESLQNSDIAEDTTIDQTLDSSLNKTAITEEDGKQVDKEVAEKEKLLAGVREYAINMSTDIKDLLKNEWGNSINSIETQKQTAEKDRKENIVKAKDDSKKVASIEKEH